jgi:hypothetical protein
MKTTKVVPTLPEKYPKHIVEGPSMDYSNSAFPKPIPKKKKSKWGKK